MSRGENVNPNQQIIKITDPTTGTTKLVNQIIGTNFETQSIKTDQTYKWSAIGEMNDQELDQLNEKNQKRIKEIEQRYFAANSQILTAKEIMRQQQETFETREKFKD